MVEMIKKFKNDFKFGVNTLKSKISILLILSMVLTMVLPHISILTFNVPNIALAAGTELQPEVLKVTDNSSNTTIYRWKNSGKLDIVGKTRTDAEYDYIKNSNGTFNRELNRSELASRGMFAFSFSAGFNIYARSDTSPINQENADGGTQISFGTTAPSGIPMDQRNTYGNGRIGTVGDFEIKAVTSVSPDKRFVLLDLYAYNKANADRYLSMRLSDDTMVGNNDGSRVVFNPTDKLMHFVNDNNRYNGTGSSGGPNPEFNSIDIINSDDTIELDEFNVVWSGGFGSRHGNTKAWRSYVSESTTDTGCNMGWANLLAHKYQLIHKRVAFLARTTTFYVNSTFGRDDTDPTPWPAASLQLQSHAGAYDRPFRTIQAALDKFEQKGIQKGFICLQDDGVEIPSLTIDGKDITIQTTDIYPEINPGHESENDETQVIKYIGKKQTDTFEYNIPADVEFTVNSGSLTFQNIKFNGIDDERATPLITQNGGNVTFSTGTEFKNFKNIRGAAIIDVTGDNSTFGVFGTKIDNCESSIKVTFDSEGNRATTSCCAITYAGKIATNSTIAEDGTYKVDYGFEMNGVNTIYNNVDEDGNNANIYLAKGRFIQVSNELKNDYTGTESRFSVRSEALPDGYIGSIQATEKNKEVLIAKMTEDYPSYSGINNCPFEQYISCDDTSSENRLEIAEGKTTDNTKNAILRQLGNKVTFRFITDSGSTIIGARRDYEVHAIGYECEISTPSLIDGYTLDHVQVVGNGFTANNNKTSSEFGKVKGKMGTDNVEVTYVYVPSEVTFSFEPNGGTPETIPVITGQVGKRVSGILSTLDKYGYIFKGWFSDIGDPNDYVTGKLDSLPDVYPNESKKFYAKYAPDTNIFIPVTELHTNSDDTITFFVTPDSEVDNHKFNVETDLGSLANPYRSLNIPGYRANAELSQVTPETYIYRSGVERVGTFSNITGGVGFEAKMPGDQTLVNFRYEVDPAVTYTFRKEYYKLNSQGNEVPLTIGGVTFEESTHNAEAAITYTAPTRTGYEVANAEITAGDTEDTTHFITKVTGSFDAADRYKFNGNMPNQNVTIKYIYESTADLKEFIVDYIDLDTADVRFQYIKDSIEDDSKVYEDELTADKLTEGESYGYTFDSHTVTPALGNFDANEHYTATMPLDSSVNVQYKYHRNDNYFKTITYMPNAICDNTLNKNNLSPDLTIDGNNIKAKVLITTNSGNGWTFANINNRELVPNVVVADPVLYAHEGFFIDKNNNRLYDGNDEMITDDTVFTGDTVVVPFINPLYYDITINFASDGNAPIDTSATGDSAVYHNIDTWGDVLKPTIPDPSGYYYVFDAWYLDNVKVQDTDILVPDGMYVAKFKKDTSMQDALKKVLYSNAIDENGNGKINIRDLHASYIYVVADENDIIVSRKLNNSDSEMSFTKDDGIEINKKYKLYEVSGINVDNINVGDNVSIIPEVNRSAYSDCYVPAVLKNYVVYAHADKFNSNNKNVASVEIVPTSVDYEYAVYKNGSIVEGTDFIVGSPTGIKFDGLEPGNTYDIVTRIGDVITSNTGTVIYVDSINELTDENFAVTVINGTTDNVSSKIVRKGETVNIETFDEGFVKWTCPYGNVLFASATSKNTSFTMPGKNVIVVAKNESSSTNLKLSQDSYGIDDYVVVMDNAKELELLDGMIGPAERYLSENGFKLQYKVVYNKDILTLEEQDALANADGPATGIAARGAIALDVNVDRYLDGKRLDNFEERVLPNNGLDATLGDIEELFGSEVVDKVSGLKEYLEGKEEEVVEPTTEKTKENTKESTEEETEAEEDETTKASKTKEETTTIESESSETEMSNDETTAKTSSDNINETSETVTETSETVTETSETVAETSETATETSETETSETVVETSETETETSETEAEDDNAESKEETVAGFASGTDKLVAEKHIDYEELVENLLLFGSNFTNEINVNTYVILPKTDMNNKEYTIYKSSDGNLVEVPSIIDDTDEMGTYGVIGFNATNGSRYVIAYNKYNDVTFINNTPGAHEQSGTDLKKVLTVKYGDTLEDRSDEVPDISKDYTYNRATYENAVWVYESEERSADNVYAIDDEILTAITLYANYETDADYVAGLVDRANAALERALKILDNYFLLAKEQSGIKSSYNKLKALVDNILSSNVDLLDSTDELVALLDKIEPKIAKREEEYKNQDKKKEKSSSVPSSGSSGGSGGGGGGGGSGGGGGGSSLSSLPSVNTGLDPLSQVNTNLTANNFVTNNIVVPSVLTSKTGMTKVSFNESISSFVRSDGSLAKSEWIETNYGWYHANSTGTLDTGWNKFGNDWYYFEETNVNNCKNLMHTGWLQTTTNNVVSTYFMSTNGNMLTGYQLINGQTYYFDVVDGSLAINKTLPDGRTAGSDGIVR